MARGSRFMGKVRKVGIKAGKKVGTNLRRMKRRVKGKMAQALVGAMSGNGKKNVFKRLGVAKALKKIGRDKLAKKFVRTGRRKLSAILDQL